jgi:putative proteasome-type protease
VTYCAAVVVDDGLVFVSDSRTNAGVDQINTFSKMHRFCGDGERHITVLTSGNLATSQAVIRRLGRDLDDSHLPNLKSVAHLAEAADYIGSISLAAQQRHRGKSGDQFDAGASFIVGGQIAGKEPQIFMVYPEGNHIRATPRTPYLQIGELKYGKPILDRIIDARLDLETAGRCAMVSMDSTLRSNITVGPPLELLTCREGTFDGGEHRVFEEDDDYLRNLRKSWQENLIKAFEGLPRLPITNKPSHVRLVEDIPADH